MSRLPEGPLALLFTDIEGSTRLARRLGTRYPDALTTHQQLLRQAFAECRGHEVDTQGDAFFVVFASAIDALQAALAGQRGLTAHAWPDEAAVRVRMGIHCGEPLRTPSGYTGLEVHRAARIAAAGHGGQVLISADAAARLNSSLPPGVTLRDLGMQRLKDFPQPERLFQVLSPDLPSEFPPLRNSALPATDLPSPPTPLIGRHEEVEAAVHLLAEEGVQLVTLTGPGGTGKTRLALAIAARVDGCFADGVHFIPLASIASAGLVASAIAQALGLRESGTTPLALLLQALLREKEALLVLDNFEQVIDAASLVAELRAAGQRLKFFVTSRTLLRLSGEHDFPVPPLPLPRAEASAAPDALMAYPSVQLFVARAREAKPDFALTAENAALVMECCRRLDGLPLAIELAAARTRVLSPRSILDRLRSPLNLLTGGARDLPARHQTLRNAIAWSDALLKGEQRLLFARLAVFAGGSSLELAEEVCAGSAGIDVDVLEGISALLDSSLVRQELQPDGEPRFSMLETIREFALEQVVATGEAETVRRRHALAFARLAEAAEPELVTPDRGRWLRRLSLEQNNLRAALAWALEAGQAELGLRIAGSLTWYWRQAGMAEGRRWAEAFLALAASAELTPAYARTLATAGRLAGGQGDHRMGRQRLAGAAAAFRALGDARGPAWALAFLTLSLRTEPALAIEAGEESVRLFRQIGGPAGLRLSLAFLGQALQESGQNERARALLEESVQRSRDLNDLEFAAPPLFHLGRLDFRESRWDAARSRLEESLRLHRESGDLMLAGLALIDLGWLLRQQGERERARALFEESVAIDQEQASIGRMAAGLEGLAAIAADEQTDERAAALAAAAEALRGRSGLVSTPFNSALFHEAVAAARFRLGEEAFALAYSRGHAMNADHAFRFALQRDSITAELAPGG